MTSGFEPLRGVSELLTNLRADMSRYHERGRWYRNLGFWIGAIYRFGVLSDRMRPRAVRFPFVATYKVAALPIRVLRRVELPLGATIGSGLCLPNPYEILMPSFVEIGRDCTLHHGVVFGVGPVPGVPKLGDGVCVHSNARVIGGIHVGSNVEVLPNAVVARDVCDDTVVQSPVSRVSIGDRASCAVDRQECSPVDADHPSAIGLAEPHGTTNRTISEWAGAQKAQRQP